MYCDCMKYCMSSVIMPKIQCIKYHCMDLLLKIYLHFHFHEGLEISFEVCPSVLLTDKLSLVLDSDISNVYIYW